MVSTTSAAICRRSRPGPEGAPYLRNGSVPTLWHLLNADERPSRFMVGG
ncbi:MAG: hypothetical protein ACPHO4_11530 [Longimicrobiales bacterium]